MQYTERVEHIRRVLSNISTLTHKPVSDDTPALVFTTLCNVDNKHVATSWCIITDDNPSFVHNAQIGSFHDDDVALWWERAKRVSFSESRVDEWVLLFNELLLKDIPFIGEEIYAPPAFSRGLAEMHNLKLKFQILKARSHLGSQPDFKSENENVLDDTLNALLRCMQHRLTYMIMYHPRVLHELSDNPERMENFSLSVFEFIERIIDEEFLYQTLQSILNFHRWQDVARASSRLHVDAIQSDFTRLFDILNAVCAICQHLNKETRPISLCAKNETELALLKELIGLMYPMDVLYDGPFKFDASFVNQQTDLYIAQCASVVPDENTQ